MLEMKDAIDAVRELGSFGLIAYGIIRSLRIAESISTAIIKAFDRQAENIGSMEKRSASFEKKIDDLEELVKVNTHALANRINEAEINISRGLSGQAPYGKTR